MRTFGRKVKTANNNLPENSVFSIDRVARKSFALSRLEHFIEEERDIFDLLALENNNGAKEQKHV